MAFDYAEQYNAYWSDPRHEATQSFVDADTLANDILLSCGGGRVLDVGAGMGRLVRALLRLGVDAHGVDISEVAVERAAPSAARRFHRGCALALPFEDGSFDTVVATNLLECLAAEDVAQALREIRRVTRRTVFLRVATGAASQGGHHGTVQARKAWEQCCFEAGFRKHPAYYQINDYAALEHDGPYVTILLERLPEAAAERYPLGALVAERDLHMDMFREAGSRSDAHVARYQWAARYIRPGDAVLDAACGLGYGSYLVQSASTARSTLGIDGSEYAYDYAMLNFGAGQPGLEFRCGMLPQALASIEDHSIDVVISFETLEHIDENVATLAEFHRILTPGGRIITSVPNDWSDASGEDPNPFHVHVYTLERLCRELERHFVLEELVAQTANQYKSGTDRLTWHAAGRSLLQVPLSVRDDGHAPPAEWWLAVAMRSPLEGATVPYRQTSYPSFTAPAWNVTNYARDYHNPWLVRGMVDSGHRLRDGAALARLAEQVARGAPADSPDAGAALCVLAYQMLEKHDAQAAHIEEMDGRIQAYLDAGPKTPHGVRWSVSLLFVLGKLWLEHGDFERARGALERCAALDALGFSPLLCNRTVEARLILGSLDIAAGDREAATAQWRAAILLARDAVAGDWSGALGELDRPAEFGLPELASVLEYASACAFALAHADEVESKPWWWLHPRRDRLSQSRRMGKELQHTRLGLQSVQTELQNYVRQADEFSHQLRRGQEQLEGMHGLADSQARELAAYREQAAEFANQVRVLQASESKLSDELARSHGLADSPASELAAYREQSAEFANQVLVLRTSESRLTDELAVLRGQADSQTTELSAYREQAIEFFKQVSVLQGNEAQLTDELTAMRGVFAIQSAELAAYREQTTELLTLRTQAQQMTERIAGLQNDFARQHADDEQVHGAEMATLRHRLADRERELLALRASHSWRITRPLRFLSTRLIKRKPS